MNSTYNGRVLLVGEGDFSFSVAMVKFIPPEYRKVMVSTSIETQESIQKHKAAMENVDILKREGVTVLLETDATMLHVDLRLTGEKFDRIIFNFPHSGGKSNHKKNRKLLSDFFTSAVNNLSERGQILMSLCKGQGGTPADKPMRAWPDSWQVVSMAANAGLILREVWSFVASDFPEYSCTGFRSQDKGFNTERAITHVFTPGEVVNIPEKPDRYCSINCHMNRMLLQEEGHPVSHINKVLEDNLNHCFCSEFCHAPDPVLEDSTMVAMDTVMSSKKVDYIDEFFYRTKSFSETNESQSYEIYSLGNFCSRNIDQTEQLGEVTHESEIGNFQHLRFSMLQHYTDLLDLIIDDDLSEGDFPAAKDNSFAKDKTNDNSKSCNDFVSDTKFNKSEINSKPKNLKLHSMTGQVVKPCKISPDTSLISIEMLGVISLKEANSTADLIATCEILCSCLNECISDMKTTLRLSEGSARKSGIFSKIGAIELSDKDTKSEQLSEICHLWFHQVTRDGVYNNFVIFVIDLTLLTKFAFHFPCVELLFSSVIDFSKQCWIEDRNVLHYTPVSLYPVMYEHDMSFWENEKEDFNEHFLFDVIRDVAKDCILSVSLIDSYICETSGRRSRCYRLQFQSHDKVLSYNTSWKLQSVIRLEAAKVLKITLR